MTNAEARKLAEMHVSERRDTQRSLTWHETADLAHWVLARLGQEDVMDAEVAAIQERHDNDGFERIERHEYLYAWEQAHTDRGKLLKKLRAVTPAVTPELYGRTLPTTENTGIVGPCDGTGVGQIRSLPSVEPSRETIAVAALCAWNNVPTDNETMAAEWKKRCEEPGAQPTKTAWLRIADAVLSLYRRAEVEDLGRVIALRKEENEPV